MLSSVFPYFINPNELNWGGKIMFLFTGAELFIMLALFIWQPETKNRTYMDIETLYENKIPPRKFGRFAVVNGEIVEKEGKSSLFARFSRKA
jgi:MFS transporter, SP family, general alpha glucoside:H+ symporter